VNNSSYKTPYRIAPNAIVINNMKHWTRIRSWSRVCSCWGIWSRIFRRHVQYSPTRRILHTLTNTIIPQYIILRVQYKRGLKVHRCLQKKAPQYLMDYYTRASDVSSRQRLRSANRHQLMVPRHRRSTFGRQAYSVAGPMEWNSLTHSGTLLGVPTASDRRW